MMIVVDMAVWVLVPDSMAAVVVVLVGNTVVEAALVDSPGVEPEDIALLLEHNIVAGQEVVDMVDLVDLLMLVVVLRSARVLVALRDCPRYNDHAQHFDQVDYDVAVFLLRVLPAIQLLVFLFAR